ncbi:MAG: formate dehydrogenase accessory sulfurtransferase FdhD [Thermoplasmatota archaeon]
MGHLALRPLVPKESATSVRVERAVGLGPLSARDDLVASEEPMEIRIAGESVAVVMRTPGDDLDLVRGFLFTEGIARGAKDIVHIERIVDPIDTPHGNTYDVTLVAERAKERGWTRNFYASSSCGVCGKASLESVEVRSPPVKSTAKFERETILAMPEKLRAQQAVFEQTGGLHASGLFAANGALLDVREDVGRHNALDKVVGAHLDRVPMSDLALAVSGRVSFEIVQKAIAAGLPLIVAVGAPSSLAVDLAREFNVTLVGFVRGRSLNVYTHSERAQ